jgi:hypothetical protein
MKKFLILALLIFSGCLESKLKSGVIRKKSYYPKYVTIEQVQIGSIDINDMSFPIYGSEQVSHPDRWEIVIENEDNGEMKQQAVDVTSDTYKNYNVDDWIELL